MALYTRVNALLHLGEGRRAHATMVEQWKLLEASFLLRAKASRIRGYDARGRAVLAAAGEGSADDAALREALSWADRLDKERTPWSDGHAFALRAAVALRRRDPARARALYGRAQAAFLQRDMELFARAAERQAAALAQDDAHVARVDSWMRTHGIADPSRTAAALIPR
jgi:hypothetical protein